MSAGWLIKVKRIPAKKPPLPSAGLHALRDDEYTRTLAAETLTLERKLKAASSSQTGSRALTCDLVVTKARRVSVSFCLS